MNWNDPHRRGSLLFLFGFTTAQFAALNHPRQLSKISKRYSMMDAEKDNNRKVTTTTSSLSEDIYSKMLCASCIVLLYVIC
jgi:hypothetical protein